MTLSELFAVVTVVPDAGPVGRDDTIRLLIDGIADAGHISRDEAPAVQRTVLGRETLGSTGIGKGLALPHGRHAGLARPVGGLAVVRQGVDFDSVDGEPVYVVVLCLTPPPPPWQRLGRVSPVFEKLNRCLRQDTFVRQLREAESAEGIANVLRAADQGAFDRNEWGVRI